MTKNLIFALRAPLKKKYFLGRRTDGFTSGNVSNLCTMDYIFMAGATAKATTNPSGTALRSHDFPQRPHYFGDHVHPPKAALELLLQSHRAGALFMACPGTTMAQAPDTAFPTQGAYSHPGRLHHRQSFKKSSFRGTASRSCSTRQPATFPLGGNYGSAGALSAKKTPALLAFLCCCG